VVVFFSAAFVAKGTPLRVVLTVLVQAPSNETATRAVKARMKAGSVI
jgi:hypothetical protein